MLYEVITHMPKRAPVSSRCSILIGYNSFEFVRSPGDDRILRQLEALLIVADAETTLIISGRNNFV